VRAEMKRIKPDISVLLFAGIGSQTAFLLRFLTRIFRTRNDQKMLSRIWTHRVDSVSEVGRTLALNTPSHCPRSYGVFVTKLENREDYGKSTDQQFRWKLESRREDAVRLLGRLASDTRALDVDSPQDTGDQSIGSVREGVSVPATSQRRRLSE